MSAYKPILLFVLLAGSFFKPGAAQVIISFQPMLNGQTIQGLERIKIISSTPDRISGSLKISVQDGDGDAVVDMLTPLFNLHPGVNLVDPAVFSNSKISFGNSRAVGVLSQTGRFPEGNFQYCFEFDAVPVKLNGNVAPYENCYSYYIQPYTPLLLINPLDQSVICNPKPQFSWQPPFPSGANMRYRIMVSQINPGQQPADAISNNLPVINKAQLTTAFLLYPSDLEALIQGDKYAWQVTAYVNSTIVQKSEIWTFTYDCDKAKPDSIFNSYREAKGGAGSNYYVADKILKFAISNPYKAGYLDYTIQDLAGPLAKIKKLPRIRIQNGLNKIDLRLDNNKAFKEGHTYLMKINNVSIHQVTLRFTYTD